MARVAGKVAVVTGGSHGIGAADSPNLAGVGAAVAVTHVLDDQGEALAERIRSAGGNARFWHLDVTDEAAVERVFGEVADAFGKLDVLVNNAGIAGESKPTDEITAEEWDRVIAINVRGVFFCTKHAIPHLRRAGGGAIVNLSSIYGIISAEDIPPYHASKGAVRLMTKNAALRYAKEGIRVNSLHPGFVDTPLVEMAKGTDMERQILADTPMGRWGNPDEMASVICFLASDAASYMTGSEVYADGGWTAR